MVEEGKKKEEKEEEKGEKEEEKMEKEEKKKAFCLSALFCSLRFDVE